MPTNPELIEVILIKASVERWNPVICQKTIRSCQTLRNEQIDLRDRSIKAETFTEIKKNPAQHEEQQIFK